MKKIFKFLLGGVALSVIAGIIVGGYLTLSGADPHEVEKTFNESIEKMENNALKFPKLPMPPAEEPKEKQEAPKEEKAPEINYRSLSNQYLEVIYADIGNKAGIGVPDIDTFATHYEEYHKDGIVIVKNSYYLGGNENITHKFTMEFNEGDTQLIFLMIDGKVLLATSKKIAY